MFGKKNKQVGRACVITDLVSRELLGETLKWEKLTDEEFADFIQAVVLKFCPQNKEFSAGGK